MSSTRPTPYRRRRAAGCAMPSRLRGGAAPGAAALRGGFAAGLAALLAGCMNLAPPYQRPEPPVAASYPGEAATDPAPGATPAADLEWQRYFGDSRLRRLIDIALEHNRDLRVAALGIEQARALYRIRRADEWPALGVGASATRQPNAAGNVGTSYAAGFVVPSYELDFFGRVRNLSDVALAQYLATEEARRTVQIALIGAVATGYIALGADNELLGVARETVRTNEESLRLIRLRFDVGAASEIDLRQAESLLEGTRVALAQATRQRALDENALVLLLGRPLPDDLPAALPVAGAPWMPELPAGLPSDLLARRPDVRAAEQRLIGAHADIGAARAAFFPRISLTANAGVTSGQLSDLLTHGRFAVTGAAQLLQPLFDAGRNQAGLEVAQVNREIAVAQYEKAVQTAFREVADALAGRATLGEQLRAQRAQAAAEQARSRLAELRYRNGAASYLDVLDARRSLFAAQQAVVQLGSAQAQNLVTLYRVLGGGWRDPAKTP
jgi:outer membrane protein, multidrug efflux system